LKKISNDHEATWYVSAFEKNDSIMYFTTNDGGEFSYLVKFNINNGSSQKIYSTNWDVIGMGLSENEKYHTIFINEDGKNKVLLFDHATNKPIDFPEIKDGDIQSVVISPSEKNISAAQQAPFNLKKRNIFVPKSKAEVAATEKNKPVASKLFEEEVYSQRAFAQGNPLALFSKQEFKSDTILNTASHFLFKQKKPENTVSKKAQFFAGAGINIATGNMNSNSFFDGINIHPGFTVAIPLTKKLSLHSGLWAFSSVHGKEVSSKERELVNNINSNLYYNINTTTIIKASYFDVPVTLHYSIHKNWSVGSGLQLSRLYKISIREQKESFDYNNTLFSATVDQFNATPARAAIAFPRKVEINKFEPRFVAETNLQQGKWLFSAGYYYGLGKSVTLKETYNTRHQYRNEYFKLGMHYRIF